MNKRTLYLAWQDHVRTRAWFPVGQLDFDGELHRFRYIRSAIRAVKHGFFPLPTFPDLYHCYEAEHLFPIFRHRIINPRRPGRELYLKRLGLSSNADPFEILAVNGGTRMTDPYEVFPRLVKEEDGSFRCRFFLHGWRHASAAAQDRLRELKSGEKLYLALELTNPRTTIAVQLQSTDHQVLGWAPRYLVNDLAHAMAEVPRYEASVVRVNRLATEVDHTGWGPDYVPLPPAWRVLIELRGRWIEHEPMTGDDYAPLA